MSCALMPLALLSALPCVAGAQNPPALRDMGPQFYHLSADFATPHTAWAKPYAGAKPRVLVIAPRYSQRDTIELAQRLDMDFEEFRSLLTEQR